jgi:hypothetical protein
VTGRGLAFLGAGACKRCIACCGVAAAASQRMEPAHQVASDAARKARVEQLAGGLDAAASVSLAPGDDVVVSGLKSAPQHNGKRGTIVEGVSSDGGRLHVRLSETEVLAIKPENLARRRPGPGAAWLKSGLVRIDTGGLQGISALPIWDFARSSLGIPAGSWAQSAEEWHVVRAPWQNADVMWTLRARLKRRDGSSCDSETPFVFGDRFGNIDGQMKLEHRSQAPLDLTEGSQILLFPAVEVGWMFSSTGAITLRNTGAVTVTLLGIPLSDDEPHALSPVEQRSWTLRAGETQGFDYMGEWAIATTARASASIVVTEHATSGGGMGNWLGMNGPRNAEENTRAQLEHVLADKPAAPAPAPAPRSPAPAPSPAPVPSPSPTAEPCGVMDWLWENATTENALKVATAASAVAQTVNAANSIRTAGDGATALETAAAAVAQTVNAASSISTAGDGAATRLPSQWSTMADALVIFGARCVDFDESKSGMLGPVRGVFDDKTNPRVGIDKAIEGRYSTVSPLFFSSAECATAVCA